jgi:Protein of unknown function (DUF3179)
MSADRISQADAESAQNGSLESSRPAKPILPRGLTIVALVVLSLWLAVQGHSLWSEWQSLRHELDKTSRNTVVGYPNIYPRLSFATKPDKWLRTEGAVVFLWAGWDEGVGNHWFRLNHGELDHARISEPLGRDVIPAIDEPWVETADGQVWRKIPEQSPVVGQSLEGLPCVYPLLVLRKVVAVNDMVNDHPYLVVYNASRPPEKAVSIFDSQVAGRRLALGTTGYFLSGRPILYDRKSESLWLEDGEAFAAISGDQKGNRLPLVARPALVAWSDWKRQNPQSRLVIGAKDAPVKPKAAQEVSSTLKP